MSYSAPDAIGMLELAKLRLECLRESHVRTFATEEAATAARLACAKAFTDFVLEGRMPGEQPTSED